MIDIFPSSEEEKLLDIFFFCRRVAVRGKIFIFLFFYFNTYNFYYYFRGPFGIWSPGPPLPNNIFAIRNNQNSCYSLFLVNVRIATIRKMRRERKKKCFLLGFLQTQSRNDKIDITYVISTSDNSFETPLTYLSS